MKYLKFHLLAFAIEAFGLYHAIINLIEEGYSIPMRCVVAFLVFVIVVTALHYKKELR